MPAGVQARGPGSPATRLPTLQGWNPSTSFSGATASRTRLLSTCGGSGNCTRMPSISGRRVELAHDGQQFGGGDGVGRRHGFGVNAEIVAGFTLLRT